MLGTTPGVATVFLGRWFDFVANRVADSLMTLPSIFFAVAVTAALGNGLVQAMVPIGILLAPSSSGSPGPPRWSTRGPSTWRPPS